MNTLLAMLLVILTGLSELQSKPAAKLNPEIPAHDIELMRRQDLMRESASQTASYQMTSSHESKEPANGFGHIGKNAIVPY